jgi:hypothetical protein
VKREDSEPLPPEFDDAARSAKRWIRRVSAATVVGVIAVLLAQLTAAAYVIVGLAIVAQVVSFAMW